MFFFPRPYYGPIWSNVTLSADLANFLVPTPINQLGRLGWFDAVSGPFNGGLPAEAIAYLSWPLIVIVLLFARQHRGELPRQVLIYCLLAVFVFSLGPVVVIRGHISQISLPWKLLGLWVLNSAAPVRFWMYGFLIFAVVCSLWLSTVALTRVSKLAVSALIMVCLLPNLSASYWVYPISQPMFFRSGLYRRFLRKGETVFVLPTWPRDDALLWQAQTGMYFNMAGGLGPWPTKMAAWPIFDAFIRRTYLPDAAEQFKDYVVAQGVTSVVIDDEGRSVWGVLLSKLDARSIEVGGVAVYKLSAENESRRPTLIGARASFDQIRFNTLLINVQKYISSGGDMSHLRASKLLSLHLISRDSFSGTSLAPEIRDPGDNSWPSSDMRFGMFLFVFDSRVIIGELAYAPVARKLIQQYADVATEAHFVLPHWAERLSTAEQNDVVGALVLSFTPEQLARAAEMANKSLAERETKITDQSAD